MCLISWLLALLMMWEFKGVAGHILFHFGHLQQILQKTNTNNRLTSKSIICVAKDLNSFFLYAIEIKITVLKTLLTPVFSNIC